MYRQFRRLNIATKYYDARKKGNKEKCCDVKVVYVKHVSTYIFESFMQQFFDLNQNACFLKWGRRILKPLQDMNFRLTIVDGILLVGLTFSEKKLF